jgi:hypothetical protein
MAAEENASVGQAKPGDTGLLLKHWGRNESITEPNTIDTQIHQWRMLVRYLGICTPSGNSYDQASR